MDEEEDETIPCPHCGEAVYEGAERCPHCGQYLSEEDAPAGKPTWIVVGAILALVVSLMWALG